MISIFEEHNAPHFFCFLQKMPGSQPMGTDYSALAARAASNGSGRTEQAQKLRQSSQQPPQKAKIQQQPRRSGNAWNTANQSSSSIAKAAASSIAKSNPHSLKSQIPTAQQIPVNQQQQQAQQPQQPSSNSRMINSFDLHKQESPRFKQERVKSPQQIPPHSLDNSSYFALSPKQAVSSSLTNSNESLSSSDKPQLPMSESVISVDKSHSPNHIQPQYHRRSSKIKAMFKMHDHHNHIPIRSDTLTSVSLSNLPIDSQSQFNDLDSLSAPMSPADPQSNFYQLSGSALPSVSQHQFLNFPITLRKEKKPLLSLSGKSKFRTNGDEFNEDKPWKHHQNIAKLNIIDLNERKRYDGVFVTNKGSYISRDLKLMNSYNSNSNNNEETGRFVNSYSSPFDRIQSLVVREIWRRSKLNFDTLTKIWYLVLSDRKYRWLLSFEDDSDYIGTDVEEFDDGTLTRDEFIVGMWIIDQCLYGRKLPKVIPKEVWESVNSDIQLNGSNSKKWKSKQGKGNESDEKERRTLFKKVVGI